MATQRKQTTIVAKRRTQRQLEDEERWNALADAVAFEANAKNYHSSPVNYSSKKGSLVVIGSGIKCVSQFSLEAISHLKNADKVLYCVADPATEHFIRDLCPDALDLYVLYNDGKPRYETYVQMAEVTLYYARQGLNTVLVFYGHPGIFVMPSHRAIKIAQQQGIQTTMLPAISALDCLTADLGIDPSYPGLLTYEVTDLLLRNRTLLTDMHVVLWQVNSHLPVLIKHLQGIYGNDYVITHYVGAQYPMCNPTIVKLPLNKILQSNTSKTITNISTFYIPPKTPKDVIPTNAKELGLDSSGEILKTSPLIRTYTRIEPREKKAIHDLIDWNVPHEYTHYTPNKVATYLGKLSQDNTLSKKHVQEPVKTMKEENLSNEQIATLLKASPYSMHVLMTTTPQSTATKVVILILTDPKFASEFYAEMQKYKADPNFQTKMTEFLAVKGYNTTMADVSTAMTELQKTSLLPWTGEYSTNQSITLTIQGDSQNTSAGTVHVNATQINKFTFANQTLTWSSTDGNSSSASLVFTDGGSGKFSFTGKYWISTNQMPLANNISGQNTSTKSSLSNWVGSYDTTYNATKGLSLTIVANQSGNYKVYIGNAEIFHYTFGSDDVLGWSDAYNTSNGQLTFSVENAGTPQVRRKFSGYYWAKGYAKSSTPNYLGTISVSDFSSYVGMYKTTIIDSSGKAQYGSQCFLENQSNAATFAIGTTAIKSPTYSNSTFSWSKGNSNSNSGSITFHIDPSTHTAAFYGKTWTSSTVPSKYNFYGSIDSTYLKEWAGVYTTYTQFDSTWSPGAQLVLNSATAPKDIQVTYGGTAIKSPVFNNPVLSWSSTSGNITNASLTFYYPKDSTSPKCYGKLWVGTAEPSTNTFQGSIDTSYLRSWTGSYNTYFKDSSGKYTVDAPTIAVFGGLTEASSTVYIDGVAITKFKYSTEGSTKDGYLQWSDTDNATGGEVRFYIDSTLIHSVFGKYWKQGETKPTSDNWYGNTNPRTPHYSSSGARSSGQTAASAAKSFWTWYNVLDSLAMGLLLMTLITIALHGRGWYKSFKAWRAERALKKAQEKLESENPNEDSVQLEETSPNVISESNKVEVEIQNSQRISDTNVSSNENDVTGSGSGQMEESGLNSNDGLINEPAAPQEIPQMQVVENAPNIEIQPPRPLESNLPQSSEVTQEQQQQIETNNTENTSITEEDTVEVTM